MKNIKRFSEENEKLLKDMILDAYYNKKEIPEFSNIIKDILCEDNNLDKSLSFEEIFKHEGCLDEWNYLLCDTVMNIHAEKISESTLAWGDSTSFSINKRL